MGNDGSGKTTIAKAIETKLKELGLDVEYHPGFNHTTLDFLLKLFGKNVNKTRKKFLKKEDKKLFVFKIWPFLVFFDCIVAYIKFKFIRRRKIVIFDRYFYDFLMSYEYLGYSNKAIRELFLSLPKPDIGFILDVSPEIAYKRKKETHDIDIDYYKVQKERYLKLAHTLGLKVIDTERPLMAVLNEVYTEIRDRRNYL